MRFATLMVMLLLVPVLLLGAAGCSRHHSLTTSPSQALRGATPAEQIGDDGPPGGGPPAPPAPALDANFAGRRVFFSGNPFAVPVDSAHAPMDDNSGAIIQWMMDPLNGGPWVGNWFGTDRGIPYVGVSGTQPLVPVRILRYPTPAESTTVHYPIPDAAKTTPGWIQGGVAGGSGLDHDDHMIVVDWDGWIAYEIWQTYWNPDLSTWTAGSSAVWNLGAVYAHRPIWWTSADGAGLPIFPGLVRYDEVASPNPIPHGFRACVSSTPAAVWPSTHFGCEPGWPAVGMRLRLKASVNIDTYPAAAKKIFQAMKTYGVIISDASGGTNGFGIYGTMDPNWGPLMTDLNNSFNQLRADDFEVVQMNFGAPSDWPCQPQ